MKNIILLISVFFASFCYAQEEQTKLQLITQGAHILARQFHASKKPHQAKILAQFLNQIDKDNAQTKQLIEIIKTSAQIRINSRLKDNGLQYAKFLFTNGPELPDTIEKKMKQFLLGIVCTSLNKNSSAKKYLPNPSIINTNSFYKSLFPSSNSLDQPMTPLQVFKEAVLPSFQFNPTELLKAINFVNYQLRKTGTQLKFKLIAGKKGSKAIYIDSVDDSNGYIIYSGSPNMAAQNINITMKNMQLREFLNYLKHTTLFEFRLNTQNKLIEIVDADNGKRGRPQNFKSTETLVRDIEKSKTHAQLNFDNKTMQIKGIVTHTTNKLTNEKFFILLDGLIIVEINKNRLKDKSLALIEQQLKDATANETSFELVVRGKAFIQSATKIRIKECYSILSENTAFFYTKSLTK